MQIGVTTRRFEVLTIAVATEPLVSFGAITGTQGLAVGFGELHGHDERVGDATVTDMIRVSVYYPSSDGSTFNHDYYHATHVPLAQRAWNPVSTTVEKGVNGPHVAAVHMTFASMDAFNAAMGSPLTGDVMTDVANYTNIVPVMQISEVIAS